LLRITTRRIDAVQAHNVRRVVLQLDSSSTRQQVHDEDDRRDHEKNVYEVATYTTDET
jgi:hypothetical protein